MTLAGAGDPLTSATSLHAVLDVVEQMIVDNKVNEGGDAVQKFYFVLYKPDEVELVKLRSEADTDTNFDAFAALGLS